MNALICGVSFNFQEWGWTPLAPSIRSIIYAYNDTIVNWKKKTYTVHLMYIVVYGFFFVYFFKFNFNKPNISLKTNIFMNYLKATF